MDFSISENESFNVVDLGLKAKFYVYGHFQYNISRLSAMSADAILKMTIKLKELKIAQLGS